MQTLMSTTEDVQAQLAVALSRIAQLEEGIPPEPRPPQRGEIPLTPPEQEDAQPEPKPEPEPERFTPEPEPELELELEQLELELEHEVAVGPERFTAQIKLLQNEIKQLRGEANRLNQMGQKREARHKLNQTRVLEAELNHLKAQAMVQKMHAKMDVIAGMLEGRKVTEDL